MVGIYSSGIKMILKVGLTPMDTTSLNTSCDKREVNKETIFKVALPKSD